MSNPYIGEIRMVGFNFAPVGWAFCDGSIQPIDQNTALFNLIGTTYGGDGQQTFALPDLRGRVPIHQGANYVLGQRAGTETVTLGANQIPAHQHALACDGNTSNTTSPSGSVWGNWANGQYSDQVTNAQLNSASVGTAGGSQPHDNMLPFLSINFVISLFGVFPTQN